MNKETAYIVKNSDSKLLDKAFSFYKEKDYEQAQHFFALFLEENENAQAYFYRGKSLLYQGKYIEAIGCFENARELSPQDIDIYIEEIITLLHLNFPKKALQRIEEALKFNVKSQKLFFLKGCVLSQQKNYRQAISFFISAIKNGENSANAFSELAMAYFLLKDYKKARIYFNFAHKICSGQSDFAIRQSYYEALSLKELKQYKKALAVLNKISAAYKSEYFTDILSLQSICCYHLGKTKEALVYINASIGTNPALSQSYKTKAAILKYMNQIKESQDCEETATQIENENERKNLLTREFVEKQANELKSKIENYEEKTAYFNDKLKERPADASLYSQKAAILIDLEQYHEAIFCCNKALQLNPNEKNAIKDKSRALFALGRYEEALDCIISIN